MKRIPPEPSRGNKITADLIRDLIRCIRERTIIKGANYSLSTSPNGTTLKFDIPHSTSGSSSGPLFRCFEIQAGEPEVDEETGDEIPTIHFINRYYNYGNITIECDDVTLTPQEDGLIVALRVPTDGQTTDPAALIVTYADMAELMADQKELDHCVIPLYSLSESFTILCDFRSMPRALVGENLIGQNQ